MEDRNGIIISLRMTAVNRRMDTRGVDVDVSILRAVASASPN